MFVGQRHTIFHQSLHAFDAQLATETTVLLYHLSQMGE